MSQILQHIDAAAFFAAFVLVIMGAGAWFILVVLVSLIHPGGKNRWQPWEGTIITAVRLAEKEVPPDVPDAGLVRLDRAVAHVNRVYAEVRRGRRPSRKLAAVLRERIQIIHDEMDRRGSLYRRA